MNIQTGNHASRTVVDSEGYAGRVHLTRPPGEKWYIARHERDYHWGKNPAGKGLAFQHHEIVLGPSPDNQFVSVDDAVGYLQQVGIGDELSQM